MTASEMITQQCDDYIAQCFPEPLPPEQMIEIHLAFYAGMIVTVNNAATIAKLPLAEAQRAMDGLIQAISERARAFNIARNGGIHPQTGKPVEQD